MKISRLQTRHLLIPFLLLLLTSANSQAQRTDNFFVSASQLSCQQLRLTGRLLPIHRQG